MLILRNVLINEGVHYETHTFLEYSSFHTKSVNETRDMLEWLVGDTHKFEEVGFASGISFLDLCAFHVRLYYEEQCVQSSAPSP